MFIFFLYILSVCLSAWVYTSVYACVCVRRLNCSVADLKLTYPSINRWTSILHADWTPRFVKIWTPRNWTLKKGTSFRNSDRLPIMWRLRFLEIRKMFTKLYFPREANTLKQRRVFSYRQQYGDCLWFFKAMPSNWCSLPSNWCSSLPSNWCSYL